jgi:hypothetical protein
MQLLSKITIGGQELKNRMVLAPMTRARYVSYNRPNVHTTYHLLRMRTSARKKHSCMDVTTDTLMCCDVRSFNRTRYSHPALFCISFFSFFFNSCFLKAALRPKIPLRMKVTPLPTTPWPSITHSAQRPVSSLPKQRRFPKRAAAG